MTSILIIDDDQSVLESLGFYLEDAGYSIILKSDGTSGLEALKQNNVSCVLTDLRMPGISGFDVIRSVNETDPDIPVIVISGTDDVEGVTDSFRLGAWDYILKPIEDLVLLEHRIKNLLEKSAIKLENHRYQESLENLVEKRTSQLNKTVESLQKAEIELKKVNLSLEDKVLERTRNLHKAISEIAKTDRILALNRLVSGISHEVNTPVGVSISGVTFIRDELNNYSRNNPLDSQLQELMNNCLEASNLIYENLVKTDGLIKNFQAISTERTKTESQVIDMHELLTTIGHEREEELKAADLSLKVDCSNDIYFRSYQMSLIQILEGLLRNSIDHAYPESVGGEIRITASSEGDEIVIEYSDNGIGITKDVIQRIFDPFFTTSENPRHIGLGLSVIFNTVTDGLNGSINASSRQGEGVEFIIRIPSDLQTE